MLNLPYSPDGLKESLLIIAQAANGENYFTIASRSIRGFKSVGRTVAAVLEQPIPDLETLLEVGDDIFVTMPGDRKVLASHFVTKESLQGLPQNGFKVHYLDPVPDFETYEDLT